MDQRGCGVVQYCTKSTVLEKTRGQGGGGGSSAIDQQFNTRKPCLAKPWGPNCHEDMQDASPGRHPEYAGGASTKCGLFQRIFRMLDSSSVGAYVHAKPVQIIQLRR